METDIHFLSCLLTYFTVQSPSWEANWFAASQEIPRISRNPKVQYRTHKLSPTVSILGQPNPVHIPTSHLLEICPNAIHPCTPRSPQWSPSLRFPHQDPIHPPPHPYVPNVHPISIFSILLPAQYWVRSTIPRANVSDKLCGENQNTFYVNNVFFFKSYPLWDNVEKYSMNIEWRMSLHAGHLRLQTHT